MKFEDYLLSKLNKSERIGKKIFVCPYGTWGRKVSKILDNNGVNHFILDSYVRDDGVMPVKSLQQLKKAIVIYTCDRDDIYEDLLSSIQMYISAENIIELFPRFKVGKYSYGPITQSSYTVQEIGSFCSFAVNAVVVANHDVYISSHEFLSFPGDWSNHPGYVPGIEIKYPRFFEKSIIGNDVWIGYGAVIIAGCNIGNGAIIGANSVVTKDVPDYAIVVGNPAKVIRYRYTDEQIRQLNNIAWWKWSDEKIIECYEDFYLDVDDFIKKHIK